MGGRGGGEDPLTPPRRLSKPEGQAFLIGVLRSLGVPAEDIHGFNNWKLPSWESGVKEPLGWRFEIALEAIPDEPEQIVPRFAPFSRFPVVERDLSLLVDLGQSYAALHQAVAAGLGGTPLQDLRCVDVFHKGLAKGRQAWLLRLRFQAMDRTLTREEVDGWMALALAAARSLGAELRS